MTFDLMLLDSQQIHTSANQHHEDRANHTVSSVQLQPEQTDTSKHCFLGRHLPKRISLGCEKASSDLIRCTLSPHPHQRTKGLHRRVARPQSRLQQGIRLHNPLAGAASHREQQPRSPHGAGGANVGIKEPTGIQSSSRTFEVVKLEIPVAEVTKKSKWLCSSAVMPCCALVVVGHRTVSMSGLSFPCLPSPSP